MKLHYQQNGELYKAGLALLKYDDIEHPKRINDVITLPCKGWDMFQLLPDFSQFLLLKTEIEASGDKYIELRQAWFGGTDERPFLVELEACDNGHGRGQESSAWVDIWRENRFYQVIKPEIITMLEKHYGSSKTQRQGDIFAYPLPSQNWEVIEIWAEIFGGWNLIDIDSGIPIYDTRHRLTQGFYSSWGRYEIAQGVITAPDHQPLVLEKICVLAQTQNLKHPKEAD